MTFPLTYRRLLSLSLIGTLSILTACGEEIESETTARSDSPVVVASSSSSVPANTSQNSSAANPAPTTTDKSQQGKTLSWSHPSERENGEYIELDDIGGYEVRYRPSEKDPFKHILVEGSRTTSYPLGNLPSNNEYQIAVFDTDGLYSDYVPISPQ